MKTKTKPLYKVGDNVLHLPGCSSLPGTQSANIYMNYPPDEIRELLETERDPEKREKMKSALKQFERIYTDNTYPWGKVNAFIKELSKRIAEQTQPAQNIDYYQETEVPEGFEGIMDALRTKDDNYDMVRDPISQQGERPNRDTDFGKGDFSSPKDPQITDVKPRGRGADPEGMENDSPPTGGDVDTWPVGL